MENVLKLSISNVSSLLSSGSLTSKSVITSTLNQIKKTNCFNAFITVTHNEALENSQESDNHFETKQTRKSQLDGLPVALKDNFCTKHVRTTCASHMLKKFVPNYNATIFKRLQNSGAILVGKCNMDEFAMGSASIESIFGPVRNPFNYKSETDFYIAGGSSGGCAVAVLTNTCFAAIGSDTGGSVRNPASYCGLVGLKPTYGLVSRYGLIPLVNSMDIPGIMTRSVDDCVIVLNCIAGHDVKDSTTIDRKFQHIEILDSDKLNVNNLRVGIPIDFSNENLDDEVWSVWNDVAGLLERSGAKIKQISMPHIKHSILCYSILNQCDVMSNMAKFDGIEFGFRDLKTDDSTEKLFATNRSFGFNNFVKNRILAGNYFLLTENYKEYVEQALKVRTLITNEFYEAWEQVDILLTPTTLTSAIHIDDFVTKSHQKQCEIHDFCTQPANLAGIPAITIPIKMSTLGLPLSIQMMSRNFNESLLLNVAKFIETNVNFNHQHSASSRPFSERISPGFPC